MCRLRLDRLAVDGDVAGTLRQLGCIVPPAEAGHYRKRPKPDTTVLTQFKMSWRFVATLVLIAWGALAFGAVYPWAFTPLFVGCAAVGGATLLQRKGAGKTAILLAVALALLVVAVGLQLVPVSVSSIRWISPETDVVLRRYAIGYPVSSDAYPLSIDRLNRAERLVRRMPEV